MCEQCDAEEAESIRAFKEEMERQELRSADWCAQGKHCYITTYMCHPVRARHHDEHCCRCKERVYPSGDSPEVAP